MKALFHMPAPDRIEVSKQQLRLLDLIALRDGLPLTKDEHRIDTRSLRALMQRRLVSCVSHGPARYRLTPMGRIVRGRG